MIEFFVSDNPAVGHDRIKLKLLVLILLMILIPYGLRTTFMFFDQEFYQGDITAWIPIYSFLLYLVSLLLAIKIGKPLKAVAWAFYAPTLIISIYTLYWDSSEVSIVYWHMILVTLFGSLTIGLRALIVGLIWFGVLVCLQQFVFETPHRFPVGATAEEFVKMFYLEFTFQYIFIFIPIGYYIHLINQNAHFSEEPILPPIKHTHEESEEEIYQRLEEDVKKSLRETE